MSENPTASTILAHTDAAHLTVADVRHETADAVSITFEVPPILKEQFDHRAGQFLTVAVPSDRVPHVARCYSLSSAPGGGTTITVKRIKDGYASDWLYRNARPGMALRLLPPSGHFTVPDPNADLLLAAAGSGITPVMSILRWVLANGHGRVTLFYANRDRDATIFAEELDGLLAAHPDRLEVSHWLESEVGLPSAAGLLEWSAAAPAGDVYICGPTPFMDLIRSTLGSTRHVHHEEYRSLSNDPFAPLEVHVTDPDSSDDAAPQVEVELEGEIHRVSWPRDTNLVEVLLAAKVDVPNTCREGWCGSCMCKLEEGTVTMESTEALEEDDAADGYILGCQARPTSDTLRVVFD